MSRGRRGKLSVLCEWLQCLFIGDRINDLRGAMDCLDSTAQIINSAYLFGIHRDLIIWDVYCAGFVHWHCYQCRIVLLLHALHTLFVSRVTVRNGAGVFKSFSVSSNITRQHCGVQLVTLNMCHICATEGLFVTLDVLTRQLMTCKWGSLVGPTDICLLTIRAHNGQEGVHTYQSRSRGRPRKTWNHHNDPRSRDSERY